MTISIVNRLPGRWRKETSHSRRHNASPGRRTFIVVICSAVLLMVGCGSELDTYPVTGRVQFPDGSPLPGGVIIFVSKETGIQSRARIQKDGTFTLGTLSKADGSVAGVHRVCIRPEVLAIGAPPKHPILRKYHAASTSDLEYTIAADKPNEFDITVEPAANEKSYSLPDR